MFDMEIPLEILEEVKEFIEVLASEIKKQHGLTFYIVNGMEACFYSDMLCVYEPKVGQIRIPEPIVSVVNEIYRQFEERNPDVIDR